jgi:mRNA-degrading endonuclease toxin of MazEF toxin-antitoxin module
MTKTTIHHPKRGEVWYVDLPNEPKDPHQPRTAIIMSRNGRNEKSDSVIVVPTTGKITGYDVRVFLPKGEGGLLKNSEAMCDRICTLDKQFLSKSGSLGKSIAREYLNQIVRAIRRATGDLSNIL